MNLKRFEQHNIIWNIFTKHVGNNNGIVKINTNTNYINTIPLGRSWKLEIPTAPYPTEIAIHVFNEIVRGCVSYNSFAYKVFVWLYHSDHWTRDHLKWYKFKMSNINAIVCIINRIQKKKTVASKTDLTGLWLYDTMYLYYYNYNNNMIPGRIKYGNTR